MASHGYRSINIDRAGAFAVFRSFCGPEKKANYKPSKTQKTIIKLIDCVKPVRVLFFLLILSTRHRHATFPLSNGHRPGERRCDGSKHRFEQNAVYQNIFSPVAGVRPIAGLSGVFGADTAVRKDGALCSPPGQALQCRTGRPQIANEYPIYSEWKRDN